MKKILLIPFMLILFIAAKAQKYNLVYLDTVGHIFKTTTSNTYPKNGSFVFFKGVKYRVLRTASHHLMLSGEVDVYLVRNDAEKSTITYCLGCDTNQSRSLYVGLYWPFDTCYDLPVFKKDTTIIKDSTKGFFK